MAGSRSYRDLIVWQKAMLLVVAMYDLTSHFPTDEKCGLVSQMRRASVSIPSNIAVGSRKTTNKHFCRMLSDAYASGAELETQVELVKMLPFGNGLDYSRVDSLLDEVMRMLNRMISKLRTTN